MNEQNVNCPNMKTVRRQLRKNSTEAERILWHHIRGKKLGFRFQRQFSIQYFVCDFCCRSRKLIIEVDGGIHNKTKEYDHERERIIKNLGYTVIRFSNNEIIFSIHKVVKKILETLALPLP
jgi:very-short-patch-repair endonuclease